MSGPLSRSVCNRPFGVPCAGSVSLSEPIELPVNNEVSVVERILTLWGRAFAVVSQPMVACQ